MIKPLSLALLLFPTLGTCAMMDDYNYGKTMHRTSAVVVQVPGSPVGAHRYPAPAPQVHARDARHHHKHSQACNHHRGRVQSNIHRHANNNYHGHD